MKMAVNDKQRHFIEDFGLAFEQLTLPRMAGRIVGWLMISGKPHQSLDELAEALVASKGSISTMTRLLTQLGIIERISLPGVRHDFFRLRPDSVRYLLKQRVRQMRLFRQLAERGLELVDDKATPTRQWLVEMHDVYAFFEQELPILMERWEQEQKKHRSQFVQTGGGP